MMCETAITLRPDQPVSIDTFHEIVRGRPVLLSDQTKRRMHASRAFLERLMAQERLIYGITTGYGPLATQHVGPERSQELQRNLVYHLATGVGEPFSDRQTRAIMAARAINCAQGYSAVGTASVQMLLDMLARRICPVIPSMGTVGASGDLTPLAHMMLVLMGEGTVRYQGDEAPASEVFAECGIEPLTPSAREGLAFVNGTSVMTGLAALNAVDAQQAVYLGLRLSVLFAELMKGRALAYDPALGQVRPHASQIEALRLLNILADSSERLIKRDSKPQSLEELKRDGLSNGQELLQDPYTIRCVPQIYGAVLDVLRFHADTVETELNAVTDNPIFLADEERVVHGGNFYGQHIAFASDALSSAVTKLAIHAERVVARITDATLNGGLPPFLQAYQTGIHSGFMGAQVTASAIVAEMRSLAIPVSVQSIPTNANNQDVVSMGTIAARRAAHLIDHLYRVLSIEALVLAQGFDIVCKDSSPATFSSSSRALVHFVRESSAFLHEDRPLSREIENLATRLRAHRWTPA